MRVEQVERHRRSIRRGSVFCAQRAVPLEHVDRIVQPPEIQVRVSEVEQDGAAKRNWCGREGEPLGAEQRTVGASDVAARFQDMSGLEHRGTHDREWRLRLLSRFPRQCHLAGGGLDVAAAIVEKRRFCRAITSPSASPMRRNASAAAS